MVTNVLCGIQVNLAVFIQQHGNEPRDMRGGIESSYRGSVRIEGGGKIRADDAVPLNTPPGQRVSMEYNPSALDNGFRPISRFCCMTKVRPKVL